MGTKNCKVGGRKSFVAITDKESYNLAKSQSDLKKRKIGTSHNREKESQESILMTRWNQRFRKRHDQ
jgi:hypothetical protein